MTHITKVTIGLIVKSFSCIKPYNAYSENRPNKKKCSQLRETYVKTKINSTLIYENTMQKRELRL